MEDHNNNKGACITDLTLGLGIGGYDQPINQEKHKRVNNKPVPSLDLTFELYDRKLESEDIGVINHDEEAHDDGNSTNDKNNIGSRKKLRLTKEQSTLLEESFKLHTTLNQVQKQALAEQLNLKHRQVEVWFQNRRARTKLKQTEVDCEFLKKCCEKLTDENLRLKEELQELRALKIGPSPLYIQLSSKGPPTLAMCSSCEEKLAKKSNIEGKDVVVSDVARNNDNHKL